MLPWLLCGILSILVLFCLLKICLLHRSLRELEAGLARCLGEETNVLLSVPSRDRQVRRLAAALNRELRLLRQQRHRYVSGDRELKEAVTNVSHDLRTPLTAVCGYLDLLEQEDMSPAAGRYVAVIRERAEAMRALTEELFRYSLLVSAERELAPEPLSLNAALEESLAAAYTALRQRGIAPRVQMPAQPVLRTLDRAALARVLANLLQNAARYSDGDLDIRLNAQGELRFSNLAGQLDEVQVGRLFDRFYTVESARSSTGLGLAIARALTERMGGSIRADYLDGRLEITLFFPEQHKGP